MSDLQTHLPESSPPPFRLDVQLHELLMKPPAHTAPPRPTGELQRLPDADYPSRPELLEGSDEQYFPRNGQRRRWSAMCGFQGITNWND